MSVTGAVLLAGAVFNLNGRAHIVHWHFIQLSVSNIVVIGVMLVVFALAILLPFPGSARRDRARAGAPAPGEELR
jgi:hypothetical protein